MYFKAKKSFEKCINDKENDFLKEEIDIPVESIQLIEDSIKIQKLDEESNKYILETRINLLSDMNNTIGKYIYYEDESGNPIDDILVFD